MKLTTAAPIIAVIYSEGDPVDVMMRAVAELLTELGLQLAGFVQRDEPRAGKSRCDMILKDLGSGDAILISEDRGEGARGCRLNVGELLRAMGLARAALAQRPDLLVANKFGRTEAEGGGIRPLIAEAVEKSVPVLVAVPERNVPEWRAFAGELSAEHRFQPTAAGPAGLAELLGLTGAHLRLFLHRAGLEMGKARREVEECR